MHMLFVHKLMFDTSTNTVIWKNSDVLSPTCHPVEGHTFN